MNPTKGQTMTTTNPVFSFLFAKYKALHEQGLDDTVEARQLFGEMMVYAPPEYKEAAHELAVKMGLMPDKPDGYSDDGEPLYSLDAMCERLEINPDEIPGYILKNAHTGTMHRVN
jgi:hypothetical protein